MNLLLNIAFLVIQFCGINSLETAVIQTSTGKVQGEVVMADLQDDIKVQKFVNIPYAEAPVGKLRFNKPEPKKSWTGIHKNSNASTSCWAYSYPFFQPSMTEDCLVLNIWTPYPPKDYQSVMVWIHGGGFQRGYSGAFSADNLVGIGDVIVVTFNYRLSVLGFLATGDDKIKGNFGLFDQRLAMKWVKENIANFGGDPESITIFGHGAGALSVSAHTLSSQSWPYFSRAILQSGTMNVNWALSSNEATKKLKNELLRHINCTDNEQLLECLQNGVTEEVLNNFFNRGPEFPYLITSPLRVDGDFFTDDPKMLLKRGAVKPGAVLLGVTKDESFYAIPEELVNITDYDAIQSFFERNLAAQFKNSSQAVFDEAHNLYISNRNPSTFEEAIKPSVDFLSDNQFTCAVVNEATIRSQTQNSTVYFYRYSYPTPYLAYLSILYPKGTFGFAAHATELLPTWGAPVGQKDFPVDERIISVRIIIYWTNFAKHGDPNVGITKLPIIFKGVSSLPNWPKFTGTSGEYLDMESPGMSVRNKLRKKYCEFLRDPQQYLKTSTASTQGIAHMKFLLVLLLSSLVFTT